MACSHRLVQRCASCSVAHDHRCPCAQQYLHCRAEATVSSSSMECSAPAVVGQVRCAARLQEPLQGHPAVVGAPAEGQERVGLPGLLAAAASERALRQPASRLRPSVQEDPDGSLVASCHSVGQSRPLPSVLRVQVRATTQEGLQKVQANGAAQPDGMVQRSPPLTVLRLDRSPGIQQQAQNIQRAASHRNVGRAKLEAVEDVDACSSIQQQLADGHLATACSGHKRRGLP
mmetsp:Transcript_2488/g.7456  ORF Transcript_2488/g.7456 Transcript_2488/m.7456 type:complete len:231 (+) Transcript_2488:607-1299(+)